MERKLVAGTLSVSATGNHDVDALLEGVTWAAPSLSYSFPASASTYGIGYGSGEATTNFEGLNSIQKAAVRAALLEYASVSNLNFGEQVETDSVHADLRFAMS